MSYAKDLWKYLDNQPVPVSPSPAYPLVQKVKSVLVDGAKFVLPPDGVIMDDPQARGLDLTSELHLPFNEMVLQYPTPVVHRQRVSEGKEALTRAVLVVSTNVQDWIPHIFNNPEWLEYFKPVVVSAWMYVPSVARWVSASAFLLPTKNWNDGLSDSGTLKIVLFKIKKTHLKDMTDLELGAGTSLDTPYGAYVIIELLNVLACSNVRIGKKRTDKPKIGKPPLPFSETWELTLDPSKPERDKGTFDGHPIIGRRALREHVRMGHIRRLSTGIMVWINATVVSKGTTGVIKKSYKVKKNLDKP